MDDISQALSHYSYHVMEGNMLLCDIQGGSFNKGLAITDPVIISSNQRFCPTDLGPDGIVTFFAYHDCNRFCSSSWRLPRRRQPILVQRRGTSMVFRQPTAATSRYYWNKWWKNEKYECIVMDIILEKVLSSIVASIHPCHGWDPGSIPGWEVSFFILFLYVCLRSYL